MAADEQDDPTTPLARTEPGDDQGPAPAAPAGSAQSEPPTDAGAPAPRRESRRIGLPVAAAVAAGLVVVSGAGGYALGAATSDDELTRVSRERGDLPGFPGHHHGDGHRFPGPPADLDGDDVPPDLDDDESDGTDGGTGSST